MAHIFQFAFSIFTRPVVYHFFGRFGRPLASQSLGESGRHKASEIVQWDFLGKGRKQGRPMGAQKKPEIHGGIGLSIYIGCPGSEFCDVTILGDITWQNL